jgi:MoaA/NifB/PqqE/SkfB family radical SAM enzyme
MQDTKITESDPAQDNDPWRIHKELHKVDHSRLFTPTGGIRPVYIRIETVNACNNDCIICAYGKQSRTKSSMSMDIFKKSIDDYKKMGGGYLSLTPLVGDVLMDKRLITRLKYIKSAKHITGLGITTNAVLAYTFPDKDLDFIVNTFDRISISIYGMDDDEYQKITQKNTYKQMLEGIRRICLVSKNQVSLEFRLLKKRNNQEIQNWIKNEVFENKLSANKQLENIVKINSIITDYANWSIFNKENNPLPFDAAWLPHTHLEKRPQCFIPALTLMVFSNGNVSFCPCDNFDDTEELRLGNIANRSLHEIYNSHKSLMLWDWGKNEIPAFCKKCSFHMPMSIVDEHPDILNDPYQIVGAG